MINEENLNKVYEAIINGKELTTKELNSYGFNSKDLADLISQGDLERIKRGYYSFLSIDNLFLYGKKLISKKEYDKATESFKKCFELDPNHFDACFQLFLRSINKKDYESAFKYFEVLLNSENQYYNADINFYLYLLSIITEVPENHKDYARYLKIEDIRVDFNDKRYKDIELQNKIRIAVLQKKFPYALKQLKDLTIKHGGVLSVQDIITKTLLLQAIEVENLSKNTLIDLIKTKQYEEAISYLESKQQRHNLSITDTYALKLTKEILNIKNTNKIKEKEIFQTENLFEAIDAYNYELALELSGNYNEKNNINNLDNIINLLLTDICNLKKQILSHIENNLDKTIDKKIEDLEEQNNTLNISDNITYNNSNATFSDVINSLIKGDLENAFRTLRIYMNLINKKDYEFLIIDLIKLSLIEKDIAFTKPMIALTYVSRENFNFDISTYIQDFYVTLSQNRFDEARIYLDIISKANKLGQNCILTDGLEQVLDNAENMLNYKRNTTILNNVEEALENSKKQVTFINKQKTTNVQPLQTTKKIIKEVATNETKVAENIPSDSLETRNSEKEFIQSKYNLVKSQGMVLLKPMNNERRKRIHNMVKEYPDMVSFSIGENENRQIVLRYKPFFSEYIDVKNLIILGNTAYKEGNYDDCIEIYLQLLQFGEPKSFVYAKLGLAYMKKWNKELAIDYLTVATKLSKLENNEFDFTELIASLNGLINTEDKKPRFRMRTEEFENDKNNNFGIENIDSITNFILESGLDVESVCIKLGMTEEQYLIVLLLYAREYYYQGNYEKGEEFLKVVERNKNKTKTVIKIFNEIRTNKKFYINRNNDKTQKLSLKFKAKK